MIYKTTRWGYYLMDGTKNDDQEVYIANSSEADKTLLDRARRGDNKFKSGSLIGVTMGWLAGLGASGSAATASFVHIGPHVGAGTNTWYVIAGSVTSLAALGSMVSTAIYGRMATREIRTVHTKLPDATCFKVYGDQWAALRRAIHAIDTNVALSQDLATGINETVEDMPITWRILRFSLRDHNHLGKCLDPYISHYLQVTAPMIEAMGHESLSADRKDKLRDEIYRLAESTATQIFPIIEPERDVQEFDKGEMVSFKDYERLRHRGEANAKADAVLQTSQLVN